MLHGYMNYNHCIFYAPAGIVVNRPRTSNLLCLDCGLVWAPSDLPLPVNAVSKYGVPTLWDSDGPEVRTHMLCKT